MLENPFVPVDSIVLWLLTRYECAFWNLAFFGGFFVKLWRPYLSASCQNVCVLRSVWGGSSHTQGGNTDVSVSWLLRDSFQFRLMMQELHKFSARERQKENREGGWKFCFKRRIWVCLEVETFSSENTSALLLQKLLSVWKSLHVSQWFLKGIVRPVIKCVIFYQYFILNAYDYGTNIYI